MSRTCILMLATVLAMSFSGASPASEIPTPSAEQRVCGAYLADEAARAAFQDHWKARIAAASPEAEAADIAQTVQIFEQVTLGYCQAGGEQPVPLLDQEEPPFVPVMSDTLIMDFLERVNDVVSPVTP